MLFLESVLLCGHAATASRRLNKDLEGTEGGAGSGHTYYLDME